MLFSRITHHASRITHHVLRSRLPIRAYIYILVSLMSITEADQVTQIQPPTADMETEQPDFLLPSLFVSAAALILAIQDPINIAFEPRPLETLAIVVVGAMLAGLGTLRRRLALVLLGTGVLFVSIG